MCHWYYTPIFPYYFARLPPLLEPPQRLSKSSASSLLSPTTSVILGVPFVVQRYKHPLTSITVGMNNDDPFTWSPERVRRRICSPVSALRSTLRIKPILNLQTLEEALQNHDVDGENLLSLEDTNVEEELGISSFGERGEIRKIIHHLRSISHLYHATPTKHQESRLSSEEGGPATTSESKNRAIQTQDPLPLSSPSLRSAVVATDHPRLSPSGSSGPPAQLMELPQKRRIQPQNISTEPLARPVDLSSDHAQFGRPITLRHVGSDPHQFDAANLSDEWQAFLERHRKDPGEPVLRPYSGTDPMRELHSSDDGESPLAGLDSENLQPPARVSAEVIQGVIDEALKECQITQVIDEQATEKA